MPFYKALLEKRARDSGKSVVVGLTRESASSLKEHLAKNSIKLDNVYQVPPKFDLLRGTPTLLFVDDAGIIRRAFIGKLSSSQEDQVLLELTAREGSDNCEASKGCSA